MQLAEVTKSILDMSLKEFSDTFCTFSYSDDEEVSEDTLHGYLRKIPKHVALAYLDKSMGVVSIRPSKRLPESYVLGFLDLEDVKNPLNMTLEDYIDDYHPEIRLLSNEEILDEDHIPDWYLESLEKDEAHYILDKML